MEKRSLHQAGFATSVLILVIVLAVIGGVGIYVATKTNKRANQVSRNSWSSTKYDLPYTTDKTTITSLPKTNEIKVTVSSDTIKLSFVPNMPVGDIYAISGSLVVDEVNSVVTKNITIEITEQLYIGDGSTMGLDINIGNQYSYDDSIAPNGTLAQGPYKVTVNVSDTKGNKIYTYSSMVTY